ncbi:uncharacterized protein LOC105786813 [Gossypium raimondii]|uniref:uncharacterized protein LOC105786813 n=1 Tax=Gossypium raimondii TaxID=29730 RepID=UPI00063A8ECF|nr:uncharacterized protein LOC105786813 [Gossypium raimondii]
MKPDIVLKIKEEVKKQFDAGFLQAIKYSKWVANIVPVPKKDGKVRMCVDYKDLNNASPKDNFPLPHVDTLVDNTAGYSLFSFMGGFSGYNQIKMHPEDMGKTTFFTLWGTFCYKVMPFGLKNIGVTYQRAMVALFLDMMHKEIDAYVDDMNAKSRTEEEHVQKAVKGSTIADFLASRALEDYEPLNFDLSNEDLMYMATTKDDSQVGHIWKLNFDGASNAMGSGIGAVLVSPDGDHYPFTCKLDFDCTNNMAEYEACIMGIRAVIEREIKVLEVYGDSALVIYQLKGKWEARDPKLISYRKLVLELIEEFDDITFCYLPRDENQMADALATLAFIIKVNRQEDMKLIQMNIYEAPAQCYNIEEGEKDDSPWYQDILRYVKNREYPDQAVENDKRTLRRLAIDYVLDEEILYKKGKDQVLLRCVKAVEAKKILEDVQEGICGTHVSGFTMAR